MKTIARPVLVLFLVLTLLRGIVYPLASGRGHLRQKLEADLAQPRHLLTETAVGYRLVI